MKTVVARVKISSALFPRAVPQVTVYDLYASRVRGHASIHEEIMRGCGNERASSIFNLSTDDRKKPRRARHIAAEPSTHFKPLSRLFLARKFMPRLSYGAKLHSARHGASSAACLISGRYGISDVPSEFETVVTNIIGERVSWRCR